MKETTAQLQRCSVLSVLRVSEMPGPLFDMDDLLLLIEAGESAQQISKRLGVSVETIAERLRRNGYSVAARPFWREKNYARRR